MHLPSSLVSFYSITRYVISLKKEICIYYLFTYAFLIQPSAFYFVALIIIIIGLLLYNLNVEVPIRGLYNRLRGYTSTPPPETTPIPDTRESARVYSIP